MSETATIETTATAPATEPVANAAPQTPAPPQASAEGLANDPAFKAAFSGTGGEVAKQPATGEPAPEATPAPADPATQIDPTQREILNVLVGEHADAIIKAGPKAVEAIVSNIAKIIGNTQTNPAATTPPSAQAPAPSAAAQAPSSDPLFDSATLNGLKAALGLDDDAYSKSIKPFASKIEAAIAKAYSTAEQRVTQLAQAFEASVTTQRFHSAVDRLNDERFGNDYENLTPAQLKAREDLANAATAKYQFMAKLGQQITPGKAVALAVAAMPKPAAAPAKPKPTSSSHMASNRAANGQFAKSDDPVDDFRRHLQSTVPDAFRALRGG